MSSETQFKIWILHMDLMSASTIDFVQTRVAQYFVDYDKIRLGLDELVRHADNVWGECATTRVDAVFKSRESSVKYVVVQLSIDFYSSRSLNMIKLKAPSTLGVFKTDDIKLWKPSDLEVLLGYDFVILDENGESLGNHRGLLLKELCRGVPEGVACIRRIDWVNSR